MQLPFSIYLWRQWCLCCKFISIQWWRRVIYTMKSPILPRCITFNLQINSWRVEFFCILYSNSLCSSSNSKPAYISLCSLRGISNCWRIFTLTIATVSSGSSFSWTVSSYDKTKMFTNTTLGQYSKSKTYKPY